MEIKVYVVLQRLNLPKPGQPGVRVMAVKLTMAAANKIVEQNPGTWVEKHVADKKI